MPPPNTPLGSNPALQPEHEHRPDIVAAEETSEKSNLSKTKDHMRQETALRERAAVILGSWEQLSWHSHVYGEVCSYFLSFPSPFPFSIPSVSLLPFAEKKKKEASLSFLRSLISKKARANNIMFGVVFERKWLEQRTHCD